MLTQFLSRCRSFSLQRLRDFHLIIGLSGRINTSMIRKSALRDVIQSLLIGNPQTTPLRQSTLVANAGVLLTYEEFYLFTRLNCSDMR